MSLHGTNRLTDKTGKRYRRQDRAAKRRALRRSKAHDSETVNPWPAIEAKIDVHDLLARLPPRDRTVLTLLLAGFTHREIATAIQANPASIGQIVRQASHSMFWPR